MAMLLGRQMLNGGSIDPWQPLIASLFGQPLAGTGKPGALP